MDVAVKAMNRHIAAAYYPGAGKGCDQAGGARAAVAFCAGAPSCALVVRSRKVEDKGSDAAIEVQLPETDAHCSNGGVMLDDGAGNSRRRRELRQGLLLLLLSVLVAGAIAVAAPFIAGM